MKITHLKTNHVVNPLGFAIEKPTFSWIVEDTCDTVQTAAQILVSHDGDFEQVIFDSGKVAGHSIDSLAYRPPISLKPRTRYFWKVRVWGETESAESDTAWFETSKMDEDWQAEWITPDFEDNRIHPILYQQFDLPSRAVTARAYICGLGLYHFELNGKKVGDEYFTPYCNAYDQWIQYQTFDITDQLTVGSNLVSVMLGNGWYKGRYGANGGSVDFYGDRFALICELHITLENGSELIVVTDPSWKAQPSPVIESDIFDGETYDARIAKVVPSPGKVFDVKPDRHRHDPVGSEKVASGLHQRRDQARRGDPHASGRDGVGHGAEHDRLASLQNQRSGRHAHPSPVRRGAARGQLLPR